MDKVKNFKQDRWTKALTEIFQMVAKRRGITVQDFMRLIGIIDRSSAHRILITRVRNFPNRTQSHRYMRIEAERILTDLYHVNRQYFYKDGEPPFLSEATEQKYNAHFVSALKEMNEVLTAKVKKLEKELNKSRKTVELLEDRIKSMGQ